MVGLLRLIIVNLDYSTNWLDLCNLNTPTAGAEAWVQSLGTTSYDFSRVIFDLMIFQVIKCKKKCCKKVKVEENKNNIVQVKPAN